MADDLVPLPCFAGFREILALVGAAADDAVLESVIAVAGELGLVCKAFRDETRAAAWLA